MAIVEYEPGSAFPGRIGRTAAESSPAWPAPTRAREGAPNVLLFVLDDVGYGQLGCFGGLVDTPNIDRVAGNGLRYANMHTTSLCSPSRACILTGRNHHSSGVACVMEAAIGYPGYDGRMPFENGMLPETLLEHGYNTFAVGKWHLSPSEENTAAGPFHRWPLGRGFERYYGFLGGETNQWYPDLVQDNASIQQPALPEDGYHLSADLADQAIRLVLDAHVNAPEKPFFLYYSTGCGHAPHHAPKDWIERYRGRFDAGWDAYRQTVFARQKEMGLLPETAQLPAHDPDVPPWDGLSDDEHRLYARMMEVYAAFLSYTDHHFGRLLDTLERIGELDNTLIMIVSDNGASSEGGPTGSVNEMYFFNQVPASLEENLAKIDDLGGPHAYNHYAWGWTWAGDTPFRRWKSETYRGGTTDPFIVSWPERITARGGIRRQYAHLIDLMPTVLDALDLSPARTIRGVTQSPLEGVSFAHTFEDADAPTRHTTQYFEMFAHRAIDHDGWRAVCPWPGPSFTEAAKKGRRFGSPTTPEILDELETTAWELYHIAMDPTESVNVAAEHPAKLRELITLWWAEAGKYQVLPLDGSLTERIRAERPKISRPRTRYTYYPELSVIPFANAPSPYNRPYSIEADVDIPPEGAEGVLFAQGGSAGGQVLYVKDGQLHYVHNYVGRDLMQVDSTDGVSPGRHKLRFEFEPTGAPDIGQGKGTPGRAQLYVDEVLVGNAELPHTTPIVFGIEGASIGYDFGEPVLDDYAPPFEFTGTIHEVTVDLSGDLIQDDEAMVQRLMAQQ
ncbi:arylsulfatase [Streptomyces kaniharaensis]|uniref:Arylsulfatase n=1 Tax=Streptomyces kaniharaensis TaxID=212423 RepID=A0A6N7KYT1_9ACTN|nr:arylsulfatase [Streptomyces kaniharaensis]MQS15527.1 arylsulfatase [Streptomyces kaniharaensis]